MKMERSHNWASNDAKHLNAVMRAGDKASVRIGVYSETLKQYEDALLWPHLARLGRQSAEGDYFDLDLVWSGARFTLEFASAGERFVLRVTPRSGCDSVKFHVAGLFRWNAPGTIVRERDRLLLRSALGDSEITVVGPPAAAGDADTAAETAAVADVDVDVDAETAVVVETAAVADVDADAETAVVVETAAVADVDAETAAVADADAEINVSLSGLLVGAAERFYVRCNHAMSAGEMDGWLARAAAACADEAVGSGGYLQDSAEALFKGVVWNTIYEPSLGGSCTPVSRDWCRADGVGFGVFGSYLIPCWDTFFAALLAGAQNEELAYLQIRNALNAAAPQGFVPNAASQKGSTLDRSQPPVGAYCVWKLYAQHGDRGLLEFAFDKLLKWNRWWPGHRDGNGDGLLEWGSNPYPGGEALGYEAGTLLAAKYESGLDNSPMYDDAVFNEETHTMELSDIGLNALYALDLRYLSRIAQELGRAAEAEALAAEYERMKARINESLWHEELGLYANRDWSGRLSGRISPTSFYPMLAGVATPERAERMVREHLLNPQEFWLERVIPSTPANDEAFGDNSYWRGRIWGPMNFLVYEGLKFCGYDAIAHEFARKSLKLFLGEWAGRNRIYENYNAVTGAGGDVFHSNEMYHWGGLLAYAAVSELVEAQPWGGLRFGNGSPDNAHVDGFRAHGRRYDVAVGADGLRVVRDGELLLACPHPVIVTDWRERAEVLSLRAECASDTMLTIVPPAGVSVVRVRNGAGCSEYPAPVPARGGAAVRAPVAARDVVTLRKSPS